MSDLHPVFEPADGSWSSYAAVEGLGSVLDPNDQKGLSNLYIDWIHKTALAQSLELSGNEKVLDFGCGVGLPHLRSIIHWIYDIDN